MGLIKKYFQFKKEFLNLPEIVRFRLISGGLNTFVFALIFPILQELGGRYLKYHNFTPAVIFSIISFLTFILGLFNGVILKKLNLSALYRLIIVSHLISLLTTLIFFVDITAMIFISSFLEPVEFLIFSAYTIAFNNFINYFYPEHFQSYQNINHLVNIWSSIFGSLFSICLNYVLLMKDTIIIFIVLNLLLFPYLFAHRNDYREFDKKYMFRYLRNLKKNF